MATRTPESKLPDARDLIGAVIVSVTTDPRDPGRLTLRTDRAGSLVLDAVSAATLPIRTGERIPPELGGQLADSARRDHAFRLALRRVRRGLCTRLALTRSLIRRGSTAQDAEHAADRLERAGLLDDAVYARARARGIVASRPAAAAFVESVLRRAGVRPEDARSAAREVCPPVSEAEGAVALAERKVRTMPERLDEVARRRRLASSLARRGFDDQTVRRAVEAVLGPVASEPPR